MSDDDIRRRAEDCVSVWNPTNFRGRGPIVETVERTLREVATEVRRETVAAAVREAIELAEDPGTDWFSGEVAREIAKRIRALATDTGGTAK